MHEFDCRDCGVRVIVFAPPTGNEDNRCLDCRFVASIQDETIRAEARAFCERRRLRQEE